jgi:hypothetical protein
VSYIYLFHIPTNGLELILWITPYREWQLKEHPSHKLEWNMLLYMSVYLTKLEIFYMSKMVLCANSSIKLSFIKMTATCMRATVLDVIHVHLWILSKILKNYGSTVCISKVKTWFEIGYCSSICTPVAARRYSTDLVPVHAPNVATGTHNCRSSIAHKLGGPILHLGWRELGAAHPRCGVWAVPVSDFPFVFSMHFLFCFVVVFQTLIF